MLLVSFDGFSAQYLDKTNTPNFDALVKNGIISEGLVPVFPSKTFPNYYAIATGLYPENNGFVGNNMYDPEMDEHYAIRDRDAVEDPRWYEGEPIWNTVEKQGKKAGTMFWVGSEAPVQNMRPTFWKKYDGSIPDSARIDTVIKWMSLDNESEIDLGTLYFSFTDTQGHRYGPASVEVVKAIQRADELMGYLLQRLREEHLMEQTNLIVVSDHGMQEVSRDKIVVLDDYINPEDVEMIAYSPAVMMNAKADKLEDVYQALKKHENHYRVYKKQEIPERFHLKNHQRVPQLLMVADPGYTINTQDFFDSRPDYPSGGTHGFDNNSPQMHALFVAHGPDLASGLRIEELENIHLYLLMTELLGVNPASNDGNWKKISKLIR